MTTPTLTDNERELWRGFLAAEPRFADDDIGSALDGDDPPDVLCVTRSGKKIGVELASWAEADHVTWRRGWQSFKDSYLQILASTTHPRPSRIGWVWLHPKHRQVKPGDVQAFREELYEFLARENGLLEPEWDRPQGAAMHDFHGFPIIGQYLDSLWIFPRRKVEVLAAAQNWIGLESGGGAYIPSWMLQTAMDRILRKIKAYEQQNPDAFRGLDEVHLICECSDRALFASNPEFLSFDFGAFAARVARVLATNHGIFNRVFLFNPYDARKVMQIYPTRSVNADKSAARSCLYH